MEDTSPSSSNHRRLGPRSSTNLTAAPVLSSLSETSLTGRCSWAGIYRHTHLHAAPFSCQPPRHSGHPSSSSSDTSSPRPQGPCCLHVGGHIICTPTPPPVSNAPQSCSAHCPPTQASPWDSAGRIRVKKKVGVQNSTPIFTTDHVTSNLPSLKGPCENLLGVIPQVPAPSLSSALSHPLPGISKPPIAIPLHSGVSAPAQGTLASVIDNPLAARVTSARCQPASCSTHSP